MVETCYNLSSSRRGGPFSLSRLSQPRGSFTWQARGLRRSLQDAPYLLERLFPAASLTSAASRAAAQLGDGPFPSILIPTTDLLLSASPHGVEGSRRARLPAASAGAPCTPAPEGVKQRREGAGLGGWGAAGRSSGSPRILWPNPGHSAGTEAAGRPGEAPALSAGPGAGLQQSPGPGCGEAEPGTSLPTPGRTGPHTHALGTGARDPQTPLPACLSDCFGEGFLEGKSEQSLTGIYHRNQQQKPNCNGVIRYSRANHNTLPLMQKACFLPYILVLEMVSPEFVI